MAGVLCYRETRSQQQALRRPCPLSLVSLVLALLIEQARNGAVSERPVDELSPFAVELRRAIDAAGAGLADNAGEADAVVRITQDRTGRRVLSVSSRNTPQEYQIFYSVEFSVERGTEQVVVVKPWEIGGVEVVDSWPLK